MQYNNILTAIALPIIFGANALGESPLMEQMRQEFPQLRTMEQMGKPYKIVHKQLATGRTPIASAENFIETFNWMHDIVNGTVEMNEVLSDATLVVLNSHNNKSKEIEFKDIFPTALSGLQFDTASDVEYITAEVTFKYSYFEIK